MSLQWQYHKDEVLKFKEISLFQHIDQLMKIYGTQIMQAVVFILEGDHMVEIKEQVSLKAYHRHMDDALQG